MKRADVYRLIDAERERQPEPGVREAVIDPEPDEWRVAGEALPVGQVPPLQTSVDPFGNRRLGFSSTSSPNRTATASMSAV
mgnify:CR=1 FL=1